MYAIIEIQTNGDTMSVLPVQTRETLNEAESVWHSILSSAATSTVEHHTAIVIDEDGVVFDNKCYDHTEPQEEAGEE